MTRHTFLSEFECFGSCEDCPDRKCPYRLHQDKGTYTKSSPIGSQSEQKEEK